MPSDPDGILTFMFHQAYGLKEKPGSECESSKDREQGCEDGFSVALMWIMFILLEVRDLFPFFVIFLS